MLLLVLGCDLVQQKQIRKQRAEMNGSVQIVYQWGTDGGLGQNQFDGRERVASVAIKHDKERQILAGGIKAKFVDGCGAGCLRSSAATSGRKRL